MSITSYNIQLKQFSRELRNNMTPTEKKLWYQFLRKHKLYFYRQRIIDNYIVDFYCPVAKLVIEIDGSQHYTENGLEKDTLRTEIIEKYGIHVMRFTNEDVSKRFEAVCQYIDSYLQEKIGFSDSSVL